MFYSYYLSCLFVILFVIFIFIILLVNDFALGRFISASEVNKNVF